MQRIWMNRRHYEFDYPQDVQRIQAALLAAGYRADLSLSHLLWLAYSEDLCAGWIVLPKKDEDIVTCLRPYFTTDAELEVD